jgi:hypothetical protein
LGKVKCISADNVMLFCGEDENLYFIDIDHVLAIELAETNFPLDGLSNA